MGVEAESIEWNQLVKGLLMALRRLPHVRQPRARTAMLHIISYFSREKMRVR
jgi:hypothetical protein